MILDYCKNYKTYAKLLPKLEQGLDFVETIKDCAAGRYESGADSIFALVEQGITGELDVKEFETHQRFIDVQILLYGEEEIYWEEVENLSESKPYSEERDIAFYTGEGTKITVSPGMFYIEFPSDGHKCGGKTGLSGSEYKKIILKLPVEHA